MRNALLRIWLAVFLLLQLVASPAWSSPRAAIRIGTTAVFLDDQIRFLRDWGDYMQQKLGRPVIFVQRNTYREIMELLAKDKLDYAWICGYPYVRFKADLRLVAVPLFDGKPLYRSYVIVPESDRTSRSILDLRGKVYAYSDPLSNSGWLVPQAELRTHGLDPSRFFQKTFFTWAHRKVVEAVASGLADGGSVDGYVWETLNLHHPELTRKTRIVEKSPEFGFPPIVARNDLPEKDVLAMQSMLLGMNGSPSGLELLGRLNLDGFEAGNSTLFDAIRRNMLLVETR